jgi:hypothetical protein
MASLGHLHKAATVRQADREFVADVPIIGEDRGPVNLLTKGQAWHTSKSIRMGVIVPARADRHVK